MITNIDKNYIKKMVEEGKRVDGRKFDEMRKIEIKKGYLEKAEGSTLVKIGDTEVVVGVKMEIGEPFPDSPDEGVLMVGSELSPISSPEFETGPPSEDAIELARVVDRGVRESKTLDFKKLCIEEGEKVWRVCVDIQIINDDGNLIDASSIGAIAALSNTKIPKIDGDKIDRSEFTGKLELKNIPIACTIVKINGKLLIDPTFEEGNSTEGRITITSIDDGSLCAMQKGNIGGFTPEEIYKAVDLSIKEGKKIREMVLVAKDEN